MNLKQGTAVARLLRDKPDKDDSIFFDDTLHGFGLRVRRQGDRVGRSWIVQYKAGGKTRRIRIGDAGTVGQGAARERAKALLAQVQLGGDPQGDRKAKRAAEVHSLKSVAAQYLDFKRASLRPSSLKLAALYLVNGDYWRPLWSTPVSELTQSQVAAQIKAIVRSHGAAPADAARTWLSAMYVWAMKEGLCGERPFNPVVNTNAPTTAPPRDRTLTDSELAAIWSACGNDDIGRITRLLLLTGCRRSEIGGMRWTEIDMQRRVLVLPAERTKNHRAHTVALADAAIEIIRTVPRMLGRDTVFGGRGDGFADWTRSKHALDAKLGDSVGEWRFHDLRRTAATRMADLGIAPHVIEAVLNHQSGHRAGVAGVYNRSRYESEIRLALDRWAERVAEIVDRPRLLKTQIA
jgi:integrase